MVIDIVSVIAAGQNRDKRAMMQNIHIIFLVSLYKMKRKMQRNNKNGEKQNPIEHVVTTINQREDKMPIVRYLKVL